MRDGQLLAMDSPLSLKQTALPGLAWDVYPNQPADEDLSPDSVYLLNILNALNACPCVLRAGLASDHLRAITPADVTEEVLRKRLPGIGQTDVRFKQVEPSLEDVFLALADRDSS
jgi:hypothetical protein